MKTFLIGFILIFITCNTVLSQNNNIVHEKVTYKGKPWTINKSKPNKISLGLQGRHFSIWASHGKYYDRRVGWRWQRPYLFCTTEDLFTQSIVIPYLLPMLERAGAIVVSPRERDWQKNEIIVDNDTPKNFYSEVNKKYSWDYTKGPGFAFHLGYYKDLENPFIAGTARQIKTTSRKRQQSTISYQPYFKDAGLYAVYVSYKTVEKSIDDAEYIVYHKGQETHFNVNQRMGGSTWVYLGTFDFDKGHNMYNRVILTNYSKCRKGIVTADAVRFGGGMGNIERGNTVSGLPRSFEGARYYTQWAGAPEDVVSRSGEKNDYTDDINSRSLFTNWLAGGSVYIPNTKGKKVPIQLSLAVHSDAGVRADGKNVGTLTICTTNYGPLTLGTGISRYTSYNLATQLLLGVKRDLKGSLDIDWNLRGIKDENYSETRRPMVPSAIIETLSHQNFNDMRLGHDPIFKFTIARSIYKSLLRFISQQTQTKYVVQPLAPNRFRIEFKKKNLIVLKWDPTVDLLEPTSTPTSYNIYTAAGTSGYDNGINVKRNHYEIKIEPNINYYFRITACNKGGESFPTEELSACYSGESKKTILIINGFHRLSSPKVINTQTEQGFELDKDPGVQYNVTTEWSGKQLNFDRTQYGKEGETALGYSDNSLEGQYLVGNKFDNVRTHAEAITSSGQYNIVSCSVDAIEKSLVKMDNYALIDLLLGLEKDDGYSLIYYKTFKQSLMGKLTDYLRKNGRLFVSGAYIASDMLKIDEINWLATNLKIRYAGHLLNYNQGINGLKRHFDAYFTLNTKHYGAYYPDIISPIGKSFSAIRYDDNSCVGVAYEGKDNRTFVMSLPFECIKDACDRTKLMGGILRFLLR